MDGLEETMKDMMISKSYSELEGMIRGIMTVREQRLVCLSLIQYIIDQNIELVASLTSICHLALTMVSSAGNMLEGTDVDNVLRKKLFEYYVEMEKDYPSAAQIFSTLRCISSSSSSSSTLYGSQIKDQLNVHVSVAECYLECDSCAEADAAVNKATGIVNSLTVETEEDKILWLRYKSVTARVMDANRKFLQAAIRYQELSSTTTQKEEEDLIDSHDLLLFLGRSATCAILAQQSSQRQRILQTILEDERLNELDGLEEYCYHSTLVRKMLKNQYIRSTSKEWKQFEKFLTPSQQALTSTFSLTFAQRALMEHNMLALPNIYSNISFQTLSHRLSSPHAEEMAAAMITTDQNNVSLPPSTSMDQIDQILYFEQPSSSTNTSTTKDASITNFCTKLNAITDAIQKLEY